MKKRKSDEEITGRYRSLKIRGKRIDEHRFIMSQILGRKLQSDEIVHHKDGNKLNNDPANLVVLSRAEHSRIHTTGTHATTETRIKIHDSIKARWASGSFDSIKQHVAACDPITGEILYVYSSIREASRCGYNRRHITSCCKGKRKQHKGLCWKFIPAR